MPSLALRLRELAQLAERDHDATGSESYGHYAEQLAELAGLAEQEEAATAVLAEGAAYVLENDDEYIGEEFAARLAAALAGHTPPEPSPERDEHGHEWRGAFCSRCGADEAGSFAAATCEPDHEEPVTDA